MSKILKHNSSWEETLKIGNKGEKYLHDFCKEHNIQYKKASISENLIDGVDAYVASVPTDVKTTPKIFLCKYTLSSNTFYARHPFREKTQALNYCIVDIDENKFKYLGSINDYLCKYYFKTEDSFKKVKEKLQSYEGKSFRQLKKRNADEFMHSIKNDVMHHLKEKIYCSYTSTIQAETFGLDEVNVCLLTYADHHRLIREGKPIIC
jgi:hypothetical protein